jgi:hypothetical protein
MEALNLITAPGCARLRAPPQGPAGGRGRDAPLVALTEARRRCCSRYAEKTVGYLACVLLLSETNEFLRLIINSVRAPPLPRTNRTSLVPHPVLSGHAASARRPGGTRPFALPAVAARGARPRPVLAGRGRLC